MDDFSDIMDLPHHVSVKRHPMNLAARAAQFSPFAALTGFDEEIGESARLTSVCGALSEDDLAGLNAAFQRLLESAEEKPAVTVIYFQPDARKSGGAYLTYTGVFRHYDAGEGILHFADRRTLRMQNVRCILFGDEE